MTRRTTTTLCAATALCAVLLLAAPAAPATAATGPGAVSGPGAMQPVVQRNCKMINVGTAERPRLVKDSACGGGC